MPTVKAPLFSDVFTTVDETELVDKFAQLVNGYITKNGGYRRRPGLPSVVDFSTTFSLAQDAIVHGLYWWSQKAIAIAVVDGRIYRLTYIGGVGSASDITGDALLPNTPVSFATDGNRLIMANGGRMVHSDGTANTAYVADTDAPTNVTHVAYLDGYILANSLNNNRFYWSNVSDSLNWSALSFASAAANPDYIKALYVFNREIFLLGPLTLEIWETSSDSTATFSRIPGGTLEIGCLAPYSIVRNEEGFYWFDNTRDFTFYNARSNQKVECPYQKDIQGFSTVADCIGATYSDAGHTFVIYTFPTANRTFVYNLETEKWFESGEWDSFSASYKRWNFNCHAYCADWNLNLVGGYKNAVVSRIDSTYDYDDYSGSTVNIRDCRRTGHINYGSLKDKISNELRLTLRRGDLGGSTPPVLMLRWKDNGRYWSQIKEISLGNTGEYDIVKRFRRSGIFRTRQYEISSTVTVDVIQGEAEEEIEELR